MSLIKQLASHTIIYGASSILGRLINYMLVPLHTAVFKPSDYGIFSELYSWVGFIMVIMLCRMETAYFRYANEDENAARSNGISLVSIVSLITALLMVIFSNTIAGWLLIPEKGILVIMLAGILLLDTLAEIPFAYLRHHNRAISFTTIRLTNIIVNVCINVCFLYSSFQSGEKIEGFGIGYVVLSNLIASGVTLALLFPIFFKTKWTIDLAYLRKMAKYALPLVAVGLAALINEVADRILLTRLLPFDTDTNRSLVGEYSACYKLTIFITLFSQAFRYAAEPFFFKNKNLATSSQLYGTVANYFTIICVFGFLMIITHLDYLQHFIASEYRNALTIVPILLLANIALGLYYHFSTWYKLADHTIYGLYISVVGSLITIIGNFFLIPTYGYIASAWITLIAYTTMCILSYVIGQLKYPIYYPISRIGIYLLVGVALQLLYERWGQDWIYLFKILILLPFIIIVILLERNNFKEIISLKSKT